MIESDIPKNIKGEHHDIHHGTAVPDAPSNDGDKQIPKSTHEDDEHSHRHEQKQSKDGKILKERKTMKIKNAPTMIALIISLISILNAPVSAKTINVIDIDKVKIDGIAANIKAIEIQKSIDEVDIVKITGGIDKSDI